MNKFSIKDFLACYRMMYNLIIHKGDKKASILSVDPGNIPGTPVSQRSRYFYLNDIPEIDKERIKIELGDDIDNIEFYPLKYMIKIEENDTDNINFFLFKSGNCNKKIIIKEYNENYLFNMPYYLDIFISDSVLDENSGEEIKDIIKVMRDVFSILLFTNSAIVYSVKSEALVALISNIIFIIKSEYMTILDDLYLVQKSSNAFEKTQYSDFEISQYKEYNDTINDIINEYSNNDIIKLFFNSELDMEISNEIINRARYLIIEYLEKICSCRLSYNSKIYTASIPV